MKYLFTLCLLIVSLSGISQWQQTGSRVRYVNGLGIPTRDTVAGVLADSSQILIRPQDSALYVKYKRTWLRVGGGGGSIAGSGTTNYIPKFTLSTAIGNSQIFDNGTNVGIGTTSPVNKFSVYNSSGSATVGIFSANNTTTNGYGGIAISAVGVDNDGRYAVEIRSTNTNSNPNFLDPRMDFLVQNTSTFQASDRGLKMSILGSGNVGIGTASPDARLRVAGASANSTQAIFGNVDGRGLLIGTSLISGTNDAGSVLNARGAASGTMIFQTDGTERMRITSGGDVGIGTTSPAAKLSVQGTTLINTNTDNGTDRLQVSGSASVTSLFGVGTSPSAGTVHIKTTSPSIAIDDNDNAGTAAIRFRPQSASFLTRGSIELVSTGAASPTRFVIASTDTMTFRTNNIERMRVTSAGGNVLISTTTDNNTDKLQVNGSIQGTGFNQAYTARTSTYTAATTDYFIDCTTGTFTVNLFTAVGNTGRILIIKNSGTGTITVDPNGSQTIDGATTQTLSTQWSRVHIISDGANWKIISN